MRPVRLELEGFTAFRDATTVDFEGADLFALTGPTGSGKSSVIDAICFALYGTVPRYDDRRVVAPAISQGRNEARVRLDFAVGPDAYTAVRVVRRTKAGATTKEARLERVGADGVEVVAGNEKELTAEVERLLGLSYDHFVKCVVLPQGEFARFLHDKPERRQELLVSLLDLGVYEQMAKRARDRSRSAAEAVVHQRGRLDNDLAGATVAALEAATTRGAQLAALLTSLDDDLPAVVACRAESDAADVDAAAADTRVALLVAISVPEGIADLGVTLSEAAAAATAAAKAEAGATAAFDAAEQRLLALPARRLVDDAARDHQLAADHREQQRKGGTVRAERLADEQAESASVATAEAALAAADDELLRAQAAHRTHAVLADVVAGEPCPVCGHVVSTLPLSTEPADLGAATSARKEATEGVDRALKRLRAAEVERGKVDAKLASIEAQLAELDERLAGYPAAVRDPAAIEQVVADVAAAEKGLETARATERTSRQARASADRELERLRAREHESRVAFDRDRDTVAALAPPERSGSDLATDWAELADWASARAEAERALAVDTRGRAKSLREKAESLLRALAERCAAAGVDAGAEFQAGAGDLRDAVVRAEADGRAEVRRIDGLLVERHKVEREVERLDLETQLSSTMARLLGASGFEKWVLDEALGLLVEGATELLRQLSNGQYSMTLDPKTGNFFVIDHRNADEPRSARTLSGGETFLASLALALALADQLAMLAAKGAARLESIFLDEGFGTLDPETLDTVAAAIEELGAGGRIVGLISHVPELAERVPVRFDVRRGPNGATITRVDK